jgi:hypothetical protein
MNANDLPVDEERVLPVPTVVIMVGLGLLWLGSFVYASGLRYLAMGMLASATVVGVALGVSWLLARSGPGLQWRTAGNPLPRRQVVRGDDHDGRRHTRGMLINPSYRATRHERPPADRPASRVAGHHRRAGAHRRQPER